MGRFLTKQERTLLEKELRLERYARFSDRIKCILLLDAGKSPESIAEYLFLSRNTIANYLQEVSLKGGLEDLVSDDYSDVQKSVPVKLARLLQFHHYKLLF